MKHIKAVNQKADRIEAYVAHEAGGGVGHGAPGRGTAANGGGGEPTPAAALGAAGHDDLDVVGLESRPPHEAQGPHFPLGCSLVFSPGWEADSQGGTAGLCQPVERDLFDCHLACFWPAHVPDQLNHAQDWTGKCASAQKDWRKLDLVFP